MSEHDLWNAIVRDETRGRPRMPKVARSPLRGREDCPKEKTADYMAWHAMAEALDRKGVRQRRCLRCQLWKFPAERCELFKPGERAA